MPSAYNKAGSSVGGPADLFYLKPFEYQANGSDTPGSATWTNTTGKALQIRRTMLWVGTTATGTITTIWAQIHRISDGALLQRLDWDHYSPTNNPANQHAYFDGQDYMSLANNDGLRLDYLSSLSTNGGTSFFSQYDFRIWGRNFPGGGASVVASPNDLTPYEVFNQAVAADNTTTFKCYYWQNTSGRTLQIRRSYLNVADTRASSPPSVSDVQCSLWRTNSGSSAAGTGDLVQMWNEDHYADSNAPSGQHANFLDGDYMSLAPGQWLRLDAYLNADLNQTFSGTFIAAIWCRLG